MCQMSVLDVSVDLDRISWDTCPVQTEQRPVILSHCFEFCAQSHGRAARPVDSHCSSQTPGHLAVQGINACLSTSDLIEDHNGTGGCLVQANFLDISVTHEQLVEVIVLILKCHAFQTNSNRWLVGHGWGAPANKIHLTFAVLRGRDGHLRQNRLLGLIVRITADVERLRRRRLGPAVQITADVEHLWRRRRGSSKSQLPLTVRAAAAATAGAAAGTPFVISSLCLLAS